MSAKKMIGSNIKTQTVCLKMNIFAWLVRCQAFISEKQRIEMISAFRNSEVPVDDNRKIKDYAALQTGSEAILTTCSVIKNIINTI